MATGRVGAVVVSLYTTCIEDLIETVMKRCLPKLLVTENDYVEALCNIIEKTYLDCQIYKPFTLISRV